MNTGKNILKKELTSVQAKANKLNQQISEVRQKLNDLVAARELLFNEADDLEKDIKKLEKKDGR